MYYIMKKYLSILLGILLFFIYVPVQAQTEVPDVKVKNLNGELVEHPGGGSGKAFHHVVLGSNVQALPDGTERTE